MVVAPPVVIKILHINNKNKKLSDVCIRYSGTDAPCITSPTAVSFPSMLSFLGEVFIEGLGGLGPREGLEHINEYYDVYTNLSTLKWMKSSFTFTLR